MMEFYEAWDAAEIEEKEKKEDEQLREDLQRTLKRPRSPEEAEAEDRLSATTESPSIVEEDEQNNTGEKLSTPSGEGKDDADEDW